MSQVDIYVHKVNTIVSNASLSTDDDKGGTDAEGA